MDKLFVGKANEFKSLYECLKRALGEELEPILGSYFAIEPHVEYGLFCFDVLCDYGLSDEDISRIVGLGFKYDQDYPYSGDEFMYHFMMGE